MFVEAIQALHSSFGKNKQETEQAYLLLDMMLSKVIENPEDAKFRTVKKDNKKLKAFLSKNK